MIMVLPYKFEHIRLRNHVADPARRATTGVRARIGGQRNRELRRGRHGQDNRTSGDVVARRRYASRHRFVPDRERVRCCGVERGNAARPGGGGDVHGGFGGGRIDNVDVPRQ